MSNGKQEAHNKGQSDGSSGRGYNNSAYSIGNQIARSGKQNKEEGRAYSDGYKNGQKNKSKN